MMKSFFKKLAFIMALAMVVSLAAPAAQAASAAEKKEFTYAYQDGGKVTKLYMNAGDIVDLKFIGVPDYKNYELEWVSVFPEIATVNQKGEVEAVADGETYVYLKVKDSDYTSKLVTVVVGEEIAPVKLGTAKDDTFTECIMEVGAKVDLNFYGVPNYNKANYSVAWVAVEDVLADELVDATAVKVDEKGEVEALAEGKADVIALIVNNITGEVLTVEYVTFTVVVPEVVEPTTAPEATVTPGAGEGEVVEPTATPEATATPEPTATPVPDVIVEAKQLNPYDVKVTFGSAHSFNREGEEEANEVELTVGMSVKVYRQFNPKEVANMDITGFDFMDAEGYGYQAFYLMEAVKSGDDGKTWILRGYNDETSTICTHFKDGATYAVIYGDNDTSSDINGVEDKFTFVAHIGKVNTLDIHKLCDATVENDLEPAKPAILDPHLLNVDKVKGEYSVDLTGFYCDLCEIDLINKEDVEFEFVEETDLDVSISGFEVIFGEVSDGVEIKGTYTYYDEDLEDDVPVEGFVTVKSGKYSTYTLKEICAWTLVPEGKGPDWNNINHEIVAGGSGQLYVIVKDIRGYYYTNASATTYKNNKVYAVNDGNADTLFEQYGYELVFNTLDPDSLLVDVEGAVETYKAIKSFAVVSYTNKEESKKQTEIGIMGIIVKDPRVLKSVVYNNKSFKILKETEAEFIDDFKQDDAYKYYPDFKLTDVLTVAFKDQYDGAWMEADKWGAVAIDLDEKEPNFTVTTSKKEFETIAENIADDLNALGKFDISYDTVFAGKEATSVTFKIKESATGTSESITIKLDMPKYVSINGVETDEVYVDPSKVILEIDNVIELYTDLGKAAKLFQVSKATQKIGFFRVGANENLDEVIDGVGRSYHVADELTSNFVEKTGAMPQFVSTASGTALTASAGALSMVKGADVKVNDLILVVTDPSGKIFPAVGQGGNNKAFNQYSNLGVTVNEDGTAYGVVLGAYTDAYTNKKGEYVPSVLEYAKEGTYRVAVYKVTNVVKATNGLTETYRVSQVARDTFTVKHTFKNIYFDHQPETKATSINSFAGCTGGTDVDILTAIAETMVFKINGKAFKLTVSGGVATSTYEDYLDAKKGNHDIEVIDVDYKVQNDGQRAVIDTVTFRVETRTGEFYDTKVKVNRSVYAQ